MERPLQEQRTATTIPPPEREVPDFPQLPQDQQWEYATLIGGQTAGFFGVIGAKQSVQWSSTLEDEGQSNFEQSATDLFYRIGRAGWELITSTTMTRSHGGTTHELALVFVFKQRRAATDEHTLAQLIDPFALLKRANKYMQQQNPQMAMKALNRALSFSPPQGEVFYLTRARVYLSLNEEKQALEDLDTAVRMNEQLGEAYLERANIFFRHNNYESAIDDYGEALRFVRSDGTPNSSRLTAQMRYYRGQAYRQVGKAKDAIKDFKECLNQAHLVSSRRSEIENWIKELERQR